MPLLSTRSSLGPQPTNCGLRSPRLRTSIYCVSHVRSAPTHSYKRAQESDRAEMRLWFVASWPASSTKEHALSTEALLADCTHTESIEDVRTYRRKARSRSVRALILVLEVVGGIISQSDQTEK